MIRALANETTSEFENVSNQVRALHIAYKVGLMEVRMRFCEWPARFDFRVTDRIRSSASRRLRFASANVSPCVFAPGISSTQPIYRLPDFFKTAVNFGFIFLIMRAYYHAKKPYTISGRSGEEP